jgi:hypothetical protein
MPSGEKSRWKRLEDEGWKKQFVVSEPRLSEAVDMYIKAGFEVHLESLPKDPESETCATEDDQHECRLCYEGFEDQYKVIFTRRKKGEAGSQEDLS